MSIEGYDPEQLLKSYSDKVFLSVYGVEGGEDSSKNQAPPPQTISLRTQEQLSAGDWGKYSEDISCCT